MDTQAWHYKQTGNAEAHMLYPEQVEYTRNVYGGQWWGRDKNIECLCVVPHRYLQNVVHGQTPCGTATLDETRQLHNYRNCEIVIVSKSLSAIPCRV